MLSFYGIILLWVWTVAAQQQNLPNMMNDFFGQQAAPPAQQASFQQAAAPPPQGLFPSANGAYMWGAWGRFSSCSAACGRGIMRRQRTCFVYEQGQGAATGGRSSTLQSLLPLMLLGGNGLSSGGDMSGLLSMLGTRQGGIATPDATAQFQAQRPLGCPGEQIGSAPCSTGRICVSLPPTAPPQITRLPATRFPPVLCLTQWGAWGQCSASCGRAIRMRMRECNCKDPTSGAPTCSEMLMLSELCVGLPSCSKATSAPPTFAPLPTTVPIDLASWETWQSWTVCSSQCGQEGYSSRRRLCTGSGSCEGNFREVRQCPFIACTAPPSLVWTQWGPYGECSETCGDGKKFRSRSCPVSGRCPGNALESSDCTNGPCSTPPPPPTWSEWGLFSDCSETCGPGTQIRSRNCPRLNACLGYAEEAISCNLQPCPAPPTWSQWGSYGDCSKTCGVGEKIRTRFCSVLGQCVGEDLETSGCINDPCPTAPPAATWATWGTYGDCSKTCGVGEMTRRRICTVPGVCSGEDSETVPCLREICPPPITWSQWSSYDACSQTCGIGEKIRRRNCPVPGECPGPSSEKVDCLLRPCPTPAVWSDWGPYGTCSKTCGVGRKYRRRICSVIAQCDGYSSESAECINNEPCTTSSPEPAWSQWSTYSACSKTCGLGERTQNRTCSIPGACVGMSTVTIPCLIRRCPVAPSWTQWSSYSECPTTCGEGQKTRFRSCSAVGQCEGASSETIDCGNELCPTPPPVPTWTQWTSYSSCSASCAIGERTRLRSCPIPGICPGSDREALSCNNGPCAETTTWNSWSQYTPCNTTCGEGMRTRYRTCPVAGKCKGSGVEYSSCVNVDCLPKPLAAQWGSWGTYSACSETCGVGIQVRFRICSSGNSCPGFGLEERTCTVEPCLACNFTNIEERRDCGFPGITKTACTERGCCYDDAVDGLIWCFYGASTEDEVRTAAEAGKSGQPKRAT